MRLEMQAAILLFEAKKRRLTGELRLLEDHKHIMGIDKYYARQQIIEMKLNELDEEQIAYHHRRQKKVESYARKYLSRRN